MTYTNGTLNDLVTADGRGGGCDGDGSCGDGQSGSVGCGH